jgi:hypothetical protein
LKALISATLLLSICATVQSQMQNDQKRVPVKFICDCSDSVGKLYATAFRDLLAKSPRFVQDGPFDRTGGSSGNPPSMLVSVVSIDPIGDGQNSALSEAYLLGDSIFLTHSVRWCPKDRADHCAAATLSDLDEQVQLLLDAKAKDDARTPRKEMK